MKLPIKIVIPALVTVIGLASYASSRAAPPFSDTGESHPECQYEGRPLVNGQCDNSDPAIVQEPPKQTEIVKQPPQETPHCIE